VAVGVVITLLGDYDVAFDHVKGGKTENYLEVVIL